MMSTTTRLAFITCVAALANRGIAADPNPVDPFLPIAKIGVSTDSNELWQNLVTADASIRKSFDRLSKGRGPDAKEVSKLYVTVEQFRRWQQSLDACYEPAAVDFQFREQEYGKFLANTLTRFWATPKSGPVRQKALAQLQKSFAKRTKEIQSFGQLLASDPRAAEKKLDSYYDKTFALGGLLNPKNKRVVYDNLNATEGKIRSTMARVRRNQARQDINQEISKLREKYETLINDSLSIQFTGENAQWKGQSLAGPELFKAIAAEWKMAHLAAVRYSALRQVLTSKGPVAVGYGEDYGDEYGNPSGEQPTSTTASSNGEAAKLASRIVSGLAKLITSDAQSCSPADALTKYHDYVGQIADIRMRLDASVNLTKLDESLSVLSEKAELDEVAFNYDYATSEILDWRRKFASASQQHLQKQCPSVDDLAQRKLTSVANKPKLYTVKNGDYPVLLKPVPSVVEDVDQVIGSAVCSTGRLRVLDNGSMWMSSLTGGFYSRVRLDASILNNEQLQMLRHDLLADDSGKPLSVAAAAALLSAERGDFENVGGKASNVAIESSLARYCSLPPIASNLVPIGRELPKVTSTRARNALAIRFDLNPLWLQHEYFIVHLGK